MNSEKAIVRIIIILLNVIKFCLDEYTGRKPFLKYIVKALIPQNVIYDSHFIKLLTHIVL